MFQRARVELIGARDFPAPFYCSRVADVLIARCEEAVRAALAHSQPGAPLLRFGDDCTVCLRKIESGQRARELLHCGHSFHEDCIRGWLEACNSPHCPNCREPADLENDFEESLKRTLFGQREDEGGGSDSSGSDGPEIGHVIYHGHSEDSQTAEEELDGHIVDDHNEFEMVSMPTLAESDALAT